jgi:hypothetical protein
MNGLVIKPQVINPIITYSCDMANWTFVDWAQPKKIQYHQKYVFSKWKKKTCVACACRGESGEKKTSAGGLMKNLIYGWIQALCLCWMGNYIFIFTSKITYNSTFIRLTTVAGTFIESLTKKKIPNYLSFCVDQKFGLIKKIVKLIL